MDDDPDRRREEIARLRAEEARDEQRIAEGLHSMDREYRTLAGEARALDEDIATARRIAKYVSGLPPIADLRRPDERDPSRAHGEEAFLADGARILIRPIEPGDRRELERGSKYLGALSRYRHLRAAGEYPEAEELAPPADASRPWRETLVAISGATGEGIGLARYVCDPADPTRAELDFTVLDLWQGRGVATALGERLARRAADHGVRQVTAHVVVDDKAAMRLLSHVGEVLATERDAGVVTVTARLRPPAAQADP